MKLNNFERRIAIDICNKPSTILMWRKKAPHAFNNVFKLLFDVSFGVEIEIHKDELNLNKFSKKIFKTVNKGEIEYLIADNYQNVIKYHEQLIKHIPLKIKERINYEFIERTFHMDGNHMEFSAPVCAGNLHYIQEYLRKIESCLLHPIGNKNDQNTSMHLHIMFPNQESIWKRSIQDEEIKKAIVAYNLIKTGKEIEIGYISQDTISENFNNCYYKLLGKDPVGIRHKGIINHRIQLELRFYLGTTNLSTILKRVAIERAKLALFQFEESYEDSTIKFLIDQVI